MFSYQLASIIQNSKTQHLMVIQGVLEHQLSAHSGEKRGKQPGKTGTC